MNKGDHQMVDIQQFKIFDRVRLLEGWTGKRRRKDGTFTTFELEAGSTGIVMDVLTLLDELLVLILIRDRDDIERKTLVPAELVVIERRLPKPHVTARPARLHPP